MWPSRLSCNPRPGCRALCRVRVVTDDVDDIGVDEENRLLLKDLASEAHGFLSANISLHRLENEIPNTF